jgi:hypothetical protein
MLVERTAVGAALLDDLKKILAEAARAEADSDLPKRWVEAGS